MTPNTTRPFVEVSAALARLLPETAHPRKPSVAKCAATTTAIAPPGRRKHPRHALRLLPQVIVRHTASASQP